MNDKLKLQIEELKKALNRLKEALMLPPLAINKDGTIQRFEFTFELSWKLMQTMARLNSLESVGSKESIRFGAQFGLIEDVEAWFDFLEARNLSSHIYNENEANEVYELTKEFVTEAEKFLGKVSEKM